VIFENLKLFRDIAQMKSISRGAMLNEVSQSAASQYMQEMERRLGVSLLDRTTRPLALTPAGKRSRGAVKQAHAQTPHHATFGPDAGGQAIFRSVP